jgi:hypothetical protein
MNSRFGARAQAGVVRAAQAQLAAWAPIVAASITKR